MSVQPSTRTASGSREPSPTPSGRLLLRMPPELHGELARAAERAGTSLNQFITATLTRAVASADGAEAGTDGRAERSRRPVVLLLVVNALVVGLAAAAAVAILLVALLR